MVRINWTFQSRDDLHNIADFISKDSMRYAKLQVVRLKNKTQLLKSHIRIGRIVPEINIENIRELIEGNYRIIYKIVSEEQIDILTVHHSARDLTKRKIK
jgi:addiction module RelE/StbE family toxin